MRLLFSAICFIYYLRCSSGPDQSVPFTIAMIGVCSRQHFICTIPLEQMYEPVILEHLDDPVSFPVANFIYSNLNTPTYVCKSHEACFSVACSQPYTDCQHKYSYNWLCWQKTCFTRYWTLVHFHIGILHMPWNLGDFISCRTCLYMTNSLWVNSGVHYRENN